MKAVSAQVVSYLFMTNLKTLCITLMALFHTCLDLMTDPFVHLLLLKRSMFWPFGSFSFLAPVISYAGFERTTLALVSITYSQNSNVSSMGTNFTIDVQDR